MERKEALSFSSHLKSMILCNCCYLGGKWLQFSRSSVKLTEWYNAAVIALEQGCAVKPMLCKVGTVGAQVMNVQEDVRFHPFLSLPSSLPIWDCSGVVCWQESALGSLLLPAAVPAPLWGAAWQAIAGQAVLWALPVCGLSAFPKSYCCRSDGRFIGIGLMPSPLCSAEILEEERIQFGMWCSYRAMCSMLSTPHRWGVELLREISCISSCIVCISSTLECCDYLVCRVPGLMSSLTWLWGQIFLT